jgi:hypothetical protein
MSAKLAIKFAADNPNVTNLFFHADNSSALEAITNP